MIEWPYISKQKGHFTKRVGEVERVNEESAMHTGDVNRMVVHLCSSAILPWS